MEALQTTDPARIGPFRLVGRLGAGGMGRVYLAHSAAGRRVAVKVVHARFAADAGFRERFRREVAAARAVSGAFTAAIVDADPDAASPWLAVEYVAGPSLHAAVTDHGPFDVPAAVRLGAGLADALVAIHRAGVVHRDLKPANVLLAADGPRVIDFGIAHPADATRLTAAGGAIGSPGYMAPEQFDTGGDAGPAIDVFALGAVLVFATTGEGPFGRAAVPVLLYRLVREEPRLDAVPDAELRALVARCLAKDPAARPAPSAVLDVLAARLRPADTLPGRAWLPPAVADEITRVEREAPEPSPPPGRATSRRKLLVGAAVGVVAAAGGGIAALLAGDGGEPAAALGPAPTPSPVPSPAPTVAAGPRAGVQRWRAQLGDYISAGPAAGPGLVYAGALQAVLALDAGTGEQRWSAPGDGEFRASIVLAGGTVFAANADGHVHALDAATGERRWRRRIGDFTDTEPVVAGGAVYAVGTPGGSDDTGEVVALDAASGSRRWSRTIPTRRRPVHVDGDTVLVAATDALLALDARSGAERWSAPLDEPTPAVSAAGTAYCGDKGGVVHALDLRTGAVRWTADASPDPLQLAPWLDPDAARALFCDETGNLVMVDLAQQAVGWQFAAGASSPPVVRAGRAVVAGYHVVHAVDTATGLPQWRFDAVDRVDPLDGGGSFDERARPAVTDDSVYVADAGGAFFALDVAGGTAPAPG